MVSVTMDGGGWFFFPLTAYINFYFINFFFCVALHTKDEICFSLNREFSVNVCLRICFGKCILCVCVYIWNGDRERFRCGFDGEYGWITDSTFSYDGYTRVWLITYIFIFSLIHCIYGNFLYVWLNCHRYTFIYTT